MTSNYRAVRAGFNYATTNMNYALGCDLNQSPKYVGLCDDDERTLSSLGVCLLHAVATQACCRSKQYYGI